MNHYDLLKKEYYRQFPDELKLEFGCVLQWKNKGQKYKKLAPHAVPTNTAMIIYPPDHIGYARVFVYGTQNLKDIQVPQTEILGKDIDMREIGKLLQGRYREDSHIVFDFDDGEIREESLIANDNNPVHWNIEYDDNLPFKDQPEVCKQLCELLDIKE